MFNLDFGTLASLAGIAGGVGLMYKDKIATFISGLTGKFGKGAKNSEGLDDITVLWNVRANYQKGSTTYGHLSSAIESILNNKDNEAVSDVK